MLGDFEKAVGASVGPRERRRAYRMRLDVVEREESLK